MASMKNKCKKKARQEWEKFPQRHQLSDDEVQLLLHTGYPLDRFRELMGTDVSAQPVEEARQIKEFYQQWQEQIANRQATIKSGLIAPKTKKPAKTSQHDPKWAEAKRLCRLNMDNIRKAKELGMSPQALIRNVPSANQAWKTPVKDWINNLYDQRFGF
jgi:hypothetical protein